MHVLPHDPHRRQRGRIRSMHSSRVILILLIIEAICGKQLYARNTFNPEVGNMEGQEAIQDSTGHNSDQRKERGHFYMHTRPDGTQHVDGSGGEWWRTEVFANLCGHSTAHDKRVWGRRSCRGRLLYSVDDVVAGRRLMRCWRAGRPSSGRARSRTIRSTVGPGRSHAAKRRQRRSLNPALIGSRSLRAGRPRESGAGRRRGGSRRGCPGPGAGRWAGAG